MSNPFIIWTLQRTGGTNLTAGLVELAGLKSAPHEPFNPGRRYGHITQAWRETQDRATLKEAVAEVAARGEVIKHCVETVPWEVTEALVEATHAAGYRHLFLYRQHANERLLSLHFAKQTNIWGPDVKKLRELTSAPELTDKASAPGEEVGPVPVEKLLAHERFCLERLEKVWRRLQDLGAQPVAVSYEEIYRAPSPESTETALARVLAGLGITVTPEELSVWTQSLVGQGDQGTRDKYHDMPGAHELIERAAKLPGFLQPSYKPTWRALAADHPWILHARVDVLPDTVREGEAFEIGGVVVLSDQAPEGAQLFLKLGDGTRQPLEWGRASPRMAKEYPQARNGAKARWQGKCRLSEESNYAVIELVTASRSNLAVLELLVPPRLPTMCRPSAHGLIFDIGANDGTDTAYYLGKGFRVVAVEAIPELADNLRNAFAEAVTGGCLHVIHNAISNTPGEVEFIINDDWKEWSSAHGAPKAKQGRNRLLRIPSISLADLIRQFGQPYYAKIDIEGGEHDAVTSLLVLEKKLLPVYLSYELNPRVFDVLQILWDMGYREFQLVRQGANFLPPTPYPCREGREYRIQFTTTSSGPFGRDLPEKNWVGLVEIVRQILNVQSEMLDRARRKEKPGWYDAHARLDTP